MEGLRSILKKHPSNKNKNIHSEMHYWADVISTEFHERKRFGMYLGIIKKIGIREAKKIFIEIKQSNAKTPAKLFVWKSGQKSKHPAGQQPDDNKTTTDTQQST